MNVIKQMNKEYGVGTAKLWSTPKSKSVKVFLGCSEDLRLEHVVG